MYVVDISNFLGYGLLSGDVFRGAVALRNYLRCWLGMYTSILGNAWPKTLLSRSFWPIFIAC